MSAGAAAEPRAGDAAVRPGPRSRRSGLRARVENHFDFESADRRQIRATPKAPAIGEPVSFARESQLGAVTVNQIFGRPSRS